MLLNFLIASLFVSAVFCQDIDLTSPSGTFTSPNYPSNYPHNSNIRWNIQVESGKTVTLSFANDFNVNSCTSCSCDYITVFDGADQTASILGTFCGTSAPGSVRSTGNQMMVQFRSDGSKKRKGFSASYSTTGSSGPSNPGGCGNPEFPPNMPSIRKIVGGQEAREHSYPWMVAVMSSSSGSSGQYCGGSIIDEQWILTAAHCMEGESANRVHIKAGAHTKHSSNEGAVMRTASEIHIHRDYDNYELDSDVALVKLASPLQFNDNIYIAYHFGAYIWHCEERSSVECARSTVSAGTPLVVTGWGAISEGGSASNKLMEVTVPVISNSQCSSMYGSNYPITNTMMCAGLSEGGKDSCQGDSGGPVVLSGNGANTGTFTQVGVVSWGIGCARAGYPGVYAKVSALRSWIDTTMSSN